ncbi:MAG: glycosylase [Verrucomicrobiota bacterium]
MKSSVWLGCLTAVLVVINGPAQTNAPVSPEEMQAIYDEVKTPFKYGIVIDPPAGTKVDCPNVFRHGKRWFMVYVLFEKDPQGYTTQLAESADLLHWKPLGTILPRGASNTWDQANAGGGIALFDTKWNGSNGLDSYRGRYWMSYIGGPNPGYEKLPLSIGMASTRNPAKPVAWTKLPEPILRHNDPDARAFESDVLYKSFIFRDTHKTLGAPFVMFYNARPPKGDENIGLAVSKDLKTWKRLGSEPVIANPRKPEAKFGTISGDPQIVRMNNLWVMFYFGAFWKSGAFDTFAASRDLVHWTKWSGEDLIKASEAYDTPFAHKPWVLKHDGVVYHFYCAVGGKAQHRSIALATSKDLGRSKVSFVEPPKPSSGK